MDEEQLQQLVENIRRLRANGVSDRRINARLRRLDSVPVNSVNVLEQEAQAAGVLGPGGFGAPQKQEARGPEVSTGGAVARSALRGVSGGFADEIGGLVAGAGAALVPGGQGFSEARESFTDHARQLRKADRSRIGGAAGTGLEIAGSLLPGSAIFQAANRLKTLGPVGRTALAGAAEGGILGFGSAEGSVKERAPQAAAGAAVGGLLGGAAGGKVASRVKPTAGRRLGQEVRETSGLLGKPSKVRADVAARKSAARKELIRPLEELGRNTPEEITRVVLRNPVLRDEAERVAPNVVRGAESAGEIVEKFSFDELDTIARSIRNDASAFKRAAGSDLPTNVRPVNVKKAESALDELDEVMQESLEGFPEFRRIWAREMATGRALIEGRKSFKRVADDFESAFNNLPDDPQVRQAFREGGATELIARLERLSEPKAVLRQIQNSPQLRSKLRIILGGDDALDEFTKSVVREERLRSGAHTFEGTMRVVKRQILPWLGLGGAAAGGAKATGLLD